ncbi:MurR/RpiR family transcriptional regulator [Virgibacillus siamensis]|uniref:MurR/RpiR family transcriptional regulator n=1 Tax=Virgibacillus siamensis TaxID=480071 RepID=UPI00158DA30D|nr:MurR/RpiR family transcriptional regulator [Virgibacillus siamensis]
MIEIKPFTDKNMKLTKSEKKLMSYIEEHQNEVIYDTITDLSNRSGIGNATIVRFCKKMGYKGYTEFKVGLAHESASHTPSDVFSGPIEDEDSTEVIANKFYNVNLEALNATMHNLDYESIKQAAISIKNTKRIHFTGIGHSGMTAQETKYKFMRIGFHSDVYMDEHTMLMMASIMDRGDLVFAISHSGNTKEVVKMLEVAKENEATTICVTGNKQSDISKHTDFIIHYSSAESLFQTGAVSTKIAQLFVIDLIYTEVARLSVGDAVEKKIKTTQILKSST